MPGRRVELTYGSRKARRAARRLRASTALKKAQKVFDDAKGRYDCLMADIENTKQDLVEAAIAKDKQEMAKLADLNASLVERLPNLADARAKALRLLEVADRHLLVAVKTTPPTGQKTTPGQVTA